MPPAKKQEVVAPTYTPSSTQLYYDLSDCSPATFVEIFESIAKLVETGELPGDEIGAISFVYNSDRLTVALT